MQYNENGEFEWDDIKAESNFKKHQVRFGEAMTVWSDSEGWEIPDHAHAVGSEERWILMGYSDKGRVLVVVYCEKYAGDVVRIISARPATGIEQKQYHLR